MAPILAVLAAGYIMGIFVLLIERYFHGNRLKCWPRKSVRNGGEWIFKLEVQLLEVTIQLTAARPDIIFIYYCMILLNSIFCSVSMSNTWSVNFGLSKTLCHSALNPTVHTVCETHFRSQEKKISNRQVKKEATVKW